MTVPTYDELKLPVLKFATQERNRKETLEEMARVFSLTQEDLEEKNAGGNNLLYNRLSWAITYLYNARLLDKPERKGSILITDRGREVLTQNLTHIDKEFLMQFPEFKDYIERSNTSKGKKTAKSATQEPLSLSPQDRIENAHREFYESLKLELLDRVMKESPDFFEKLVVKLLQVMGYGKGEGFVQHTGQSGDGGIDGVIYQDPLGVDVIYVQAKRYDPSRGNVGRPDLQSFIGTLDGKSAQKGIFVTTTDFTGEGKKYLETVQKKVVTINGMKLVELMIEHGVGVKEESVYPIHGIDSEFFSQEDVL